MEPTKNEVENTKTIVVLSSSQNTDPDEIWHVDQISCVTEGGANSCVISLLELTLNVKYSIILWLVQDLKDGNTYFISVVKYSIPHTFMTSCLRSKFVFA